MQEVNYLRRQKMHSVRRKKRCSRITAPSAITNGKDQSKIQNITGMKGGHREQIKRLSTRLVSMEPFEN